MGSSSSFPQGLREAAWAVDLHLAKRVKYEIVNAPGGATLDADTGLFTWNTPSEPQTAKVTVRVRGVDNPDLSTLVSFTITTSTK